MSQKKVEEESVSKTLQDVTLDCSSYNPEDDTIDLSQISSGSSISDVSSPQSDIEPLLTDTSYSSYSNDNYQLHADSQNEGYEETDSSSEQSFAFSSDFDNYQLHADCPNEGYEETDSSSEQSFSFSSDFDHLSPIPKIKESFEFPTHLETPHIVSWIW